MEVTVPDDIEKALVAEAKERGTMSEQLALDRLRPARTIRAIILSGKSALPVRITISLGQCGGRSWQYSLSARRQFITLKSLGQL